MKKFDKNNTGLINQFENIEWIETSGYSEEELNVLYNSLMKESYPKAILKAKTFEMILEKARIAIVKDDIFQDKIFQSHECGGIMADQRGIWEDEIRTKFLAEEYSSVCDAYDKGAYTVSSDFGHTSPNIQLLMDVGFIGLLDRINKYSQKENLSQRQKDFYDSCKITLNAIIKFINRLAKETEKINTENSIALYNIAKGKPTNIYEAMQLIILYFFLHILT